MTNSRNSDEGQRRDTVEAERELFQQAGLQRLRIMGINALGVLHRHRAGLLAILRQGGSVDVLLLDPNGEAFRKQRDSEEKRNGRVSNRLLKEMEASLAILRDILHILLDRSEADIEEIGQRFRIRLYDREARISLLFAETEAGASLLRRDLPALPQVTPEPAEGVLYDGDGNPAYGRNLRHFAEVWEKAEFVPLTLLESDLIVVSPTRKDVSHIYNQAVEIHKKRWLDEASTLYRTVLRLDKPREPTAEQALLARRFLPRVCTTISEPFALKDMVVVLHPDPQRRLVGYHLMWEDDIDYLNDNDPADHEVVWVQYSVERTVERVWAYWHDQILTTSSAVADANANGGRVLVMSQWGKHGSLLEGWREKIGIDEVLPGHPEYETMEFTRLKTNRRPSEAPYADRWPQRFEGGLEEFTSFPVRIDMEKKLDEHQMIVVSRYANAVISQWYLPYNIRPKDDWPRDIAGA